MADSNITNTDKTPQSLQTESLNLQHTSQDDSPPPSSPSSLAPPLGSQASVLSRPVSPETRERRKFDAQPSTRETPETEAPRSMRDKTCERTGLYVTSSPEIVSNGVYVGARLFAHQSLDSSKFFGIPWGRKSPQISIRDSETGSSDSSALGPILSTFTCGPTLLIGKKPCVLVPTPIQEKNWRDSSQAIAIRYDHQVKGTDLPLMRDKTGKYLTSLRTYQTRSRKNSVVNAVKATLGVSTLVPPQNMQPTVKAGRIWLCNMSCEGATSRKRDWALVELDPNAVGTEPRLNVVIIGGKEVQLKPPTIEGALPGTRVVLATAGSRTTPLGGVVAEQEECVYGYQLIQRINLDRANILGDGDAGACVIDEETGVYYGMLVMAGLLKQEVLADEAAGGAPENPEATETPENQESSGSPENSKTGGKLSKPAAAWFVPYACIMDDMGWTYPIKKVVFAP